MVTIIIPMELYFSPTFSPPLFCCFSKLPVVPLEHFQLVLVFLGHLDISSKELNQVNSLPTVALETHWLRMVNRQVYYLHRLGISKVKVALSIAVHVSHVGSFDL